MIVGVGKAGIRLLDALKALGLREAPRLGSYDLRFVGVETDIEALECSSADVGFYLGGDFRKDSPPQAFENMAWRARSVLAHALQGAWMVLVLAELDDSFECAAAAGVAEAAQAMNARTVSLVSLRAADLAARGPRTDLAYLARIKAGSDWLFSFSADEYVQLGDAFFPQDDPASVRTGNLVNCAHVLLKAICLPYQQLVGCDFQDVRTALDAPVSLDSGLLGSETARFLRIGAQLSTPLAELVAEAMAGLPLRSMSRMGLMLYIEGGAQLRMLHVRDIVRALAVKLPEAAFFKYCVEIRPDRPETALSLNFFLNLTL